MSYDRYLEEDRRLAILRLLAEDQDYALNESLLQELLQRLGHGVSRDRVRTDLGWLSEQGLVLIEEYAGVKVARLTKRGRDVAAGHVTVHGIKRPSPID